MSWDAAAWLMLGGSTLLLFLGLPVAFSFLVINLLGALLFLGGEAGLTQLARNSIGSVASFSLTPIPLFILMGEVLFHTGLAVKVIDGVERLIRQVPGRLAVVAVVAGTVFSAISGSTIATTAMLGSLMLPVMLSRGYNPVLATGPIMAIGVVVIGAMSGGIATPTESAALGALATMALAAAYRALSFDALLKALRGTVGISAMILFIILGATTFSQILSFSGSTEGIVSNILGGGLTPFAILAGMMLLLIFLGIFVDQVSMMLITLPVFMPIVQRLGIDLIWFGVLYLICMQLGLLLPPHGLLLMTMKGVAPKEVTMAHIFRAVVPYVAMSLVLLVIIIAFPAIATWLPNLLG